MSSVVLVSTHGRPSPSVSSTSASGSPSTASSERNTAASSSARRASLFASVISRSGACSPKTVRVCAPLARSSGDRMLGSVSEWQ